MVALLVLSACRHPGASASASASAASDGDGGEAVAVAANDTAREEPAMPDVPAPPDVKAPPPNAPRTPSGLATRVLTPGIGTASPTDLDVVRFRFVSWTAADGKVAGVSAPDPAGEPMTARVAEGGIPGLSEGLTLMVPGEKRRMWIPAALGSKRLPGKDLVMDVELVAVVPTPAPPPVPADVARAPSGTRQTRSGLRWRLLASGGKTSPKASSQNIAVYNYTVWTRQGELLGSSFPVSHPEVRPVSSLPAPWSEALQLMKPGDRMRMWFGDEQGAPPGNAYTADVELLYVYSTGRTGAK